MGDLVLVTLLTVTEFLRKLAKGGKRNWAQGVRDFSLWSMGREGHCGAKPLSLLAAGKQKGGRVWTTVNLPSDPLPNSPPAVNWSRD